jgi:type IV secretion system protein VirB9
MILVRYLLIIFFTLHALSAYAIREPRSTSMDSRIRVLVYNPNDVFKYTGYYGYQGSIQLAPNETIDTISMGDTVSWQIIPSGNRIFLKPVDSDATTNMTLITNQRMYFFELHAKTAKDINDPNLVFTVKFLYPESSDITNYSQTVIPTGPDLKHPEKYNFNYTISGSKNIAPIKIFDDGEFTYFEFKNKNISIPAFFEVLSDNNEALVNYQVVGNYIVLEKVTSRLTLRHGRDIVCVFNESFSN